ncbi:cytoplasmic protein [Suillus fuscotomentosus]|uniref:Cytoplasmic protein n=1 Tax=Suillus fuscotomentosus TaxID=1912939 RepID=A0AAD4DXZ7_9AGAM|nr:cytoplasmic protein [Suillus fuscotomentosus]KAG1894693.1 cytoplasmic protein [Suillus fuscotomentosus]
MTPITGGGLVSNHDSPVVVAPQRSTVTILGSFLRRPRGTSTSQQQPSPADSPPSPTTPSAIRRRSFVPQINSSSNNTTSLGPISNILRRRRSAGTVNNQPIMPAPQPLLRATTFSNNNNQTHRIRLVPHLDSRRTLRFEPITRDLKDNDIPLRIGRFTDRSGIGLAAVNALNTNKLAFKSKVVSRAHAEIWADNGKFYIKDTKSSSGTFLNHLRLSPAGSESKPHQLKDGDIVQLGVDYQGGTEDIYKSVKIRIEVGREWQAAPNAFNTNALSQLRSLSADPHSQPQSASAHGKKRMPKTNIPDCCICLFAVTIRQALFIAPCSHAFHYKCIRPLLDAHTSAFSCPLCRTFADLDEDVEVEIEPDLELEAEAVSSPEEDDDDELDRSGGEKDKLAPPMMRDGAETEVEGDARGPRARIRTAGHVIHPQSQPQTQSNPQCQTHPYPTAQTHPPRDDADLDEELMDLIDVDVDSDEGDLDARVFVRGGSGNGSGNGSAEGMGIESGMGGVAMMVDGEGVISVKRKR